MKSSHTKEIEQDMQTAKPVLHATADCVLVLSQRIDALAQRVAELEDEIDTKNLMTEID